MLQGTRRAGLESKVIWVPAHTGIAGNKMVDRYARGNERMPQEQRGGGHHIANEIWAHGVKWHLFMLQMHCMGKCAQVWVSGNDGTMGHVLFQCPRYQAQRVTLKETLKRNKVPHNLVGLLRCSDDAAFRASFRFLQLTGLSGRV